MTRREIAEDDPHSQFIGAATALLFAVSVPMIFQSRQLRMYSLATTLTLAQVLVFLRSAREGGTGNYIALGLLSSMAVATHFFAGLAIIVELLWITPRLFDRNEPRRPASRRAWLAIGAIAVGGAALLPLAPAAAHFEAGFVGAGGLAWIKRPTPLAPVGLFIDGLSGKPSGPVGTPGRPGYAFVVFATLAMVGVVTLARRDHRAAAFALLWMWAPPVALLMVSYVIAPIFLEEYVLSSFAPFLIFVASGIDSLKAPWTKALAIAIALALSIEPIQHLSERARAP